MYKKQLILVVSLFLGFLLNFPSLSSAYNRADRRSYQRSIVDVRSRLNPRFKKVKRKKTKYIIVHTSELGLKTTLRVVSKGKRLRNGRTTPGGHAHYVIARNGRTYRILDKKFEADHAGRSMWNGKADISKISIGIELVGYHYAPISESQYRSVGKLIDILQKVYGLDDRAVLTHSQVAYGKRNRWFKKSHRGRKRCAKNFIRAKAQLGPTWTYDPDVRSGRLLADSQLAEVYYGRRGYYAKTEDANVISKRNTAWSIAGEDYDSRTTAYKFPGGRIYTGDQISENVGWSRIPAKTVVLLNQENSLSLKKSDGPIKTISDSLTAWSFAGQAYNQKTTIYFLPSGRIKFGSMISDWDDLPAETRLIVGYRGPYTLHKDRSAFLIAGHKYKDRKTIYYLPSKKLVAGDRIENFDRLPAGTLIFLPYT
ncbi:MAG: N-acetylmuramoyl-L-alanine amidase [Deltaproteobacteria bacterium]|jgi:N-acetylmuramoyl-L-alanine amidase|nr:N-acetylmuramoyl-L-alanine amidase [Deltaproteobacteria bacterium]NOQ19045.1 N-acetylmuramoyl-L-alanine amidase [Desulfobacterales bacterium]MBW2238203.1 N-acetylmuramoyl-L-alanine amidase [Deltaproteobacteria bacterium]MBW2571208.1 N-acetylmuramoyl-L-alanine amidase [Deltaproteobacteria bacterium]MBW2669191.1 N-acetylmuramoyl-L-alanine amidase [Deltaproteobacteria bacterium]